MKRIAILVAASALVLGMIAVMLRLPPAAIDLRPAVKENLAASGVEHPVTAVLLNFRGYDTLLEIAVLLLAIFGILAAGTERKPDSAPPGDSMLPALARAAAPWMVMTAIYLLWAGASRPGGAFQAGAVLAGAAVLLHLAGRLPGWRRPGRRLRGALAGGFLLFLLVAAALSIEGALLQYPPAHAGALILAIESGLTISLGLMLGGLFLFMSSEAGGEQ